MTIIEADMNTYEAFIEEHAKALRRCVVNDEPIHRKRLECAEAVYKALKRYKASLE